MTEGVGAAGGLPAEAVSQSRGQVVEDQQRVAFESALNEGLGTLSQRPSLTSETDRMVAGLSGTYSGDVGQAKSEIVGGEAAKAERSTQEANQSLEDRVKSIYTELTHYQIAWKIAQNVQRDVSQVLRGS